MFLHDVLVAVPVVVAKAPYFTNGETFKEKTRTLISLLMRLLNTIVMYSTFYVYFLRYFLRTMLPHYLSGSLRSYHVYRQPLSSIVGTLDISRHCTPSSLTKLGNTARFAGKCMITSCFQLCEGGRGRFP